MITRIVFYFQFDILQYFIQLNLKQKIVVRTSPRRGLCIAEGILEWVS